MLELKILDVENGDLEDNVILIDVIIGKDNNDCERKASDQYYDTDKYAWSYFIDIPKKTHGGKREGAGRPPTDRKPITRQVTELENTAIDNLLKKLRATT